MSKEEMSEMENCREIAISRFISAGGLNDHHQDTSTLLREAGVMMDRVCGDLFGPVFFEGADGRIYSLTLGASIDEVGPDYVKDVLTEASQAATPAGLGHDPRTVNKEPMLLVSVFWDNEVSGQYAMLLGEGQTVQETEEAFYEQWSRCIRALQEEDPDDEWGTDEAVEWMRQNGWRMESFEDKLEVALA